MKPTQHFMTMGLAKGLNPNPYFNADYYLNSYPEVRRSGIDPLLHYYLYDANKGYHPSPNFDTKDYLSSNPDVRVSRTNPLAHYIHFGRQEGRNISAGHSVPATSHNLSKPPATNPGHERGVLTSKAYAIRDRLGARLLSVLGIIGVPDFIIIGAQKCGTSSVAEWLNQHPRIDMVGNPKGKTLTEFHFFNNDRFWNKGSQWYLSHFPRKGVCGEKTPEYIQRVRTHQRMYKTLPKAKLIISLRNPVPRSYSAYQHYIRDLPISKIGIGCIRGRATNAIFGLKKRKILHKASSIVEFISIKLKAC